MGQAGTELRAQECREGKLLPGLATRRQEVRHWQGVGGIGLPPGGRASRRGCTDSTPGWGHGRQRQKAERGNRTVINASSQSPPGSLSSFLDGSARQDK